MSNQEIQTTSAENWKIKLLLAGGVIGALVGAAAAYLFIQNNPIDDGPPQVSAGEGVKLGVLVFGLLRSIASLGEGK
jgi:hypothetical protein